jgi:hypothetical protein
MATVQRGAERQPLVEVNHKLDVIAGASASLPDRGKIVFKMVASQSQFKPLESPFCDQFFGFLRQRGNVGQPKAVAVVCRHRAQGSAQQNCKRHPGSLCERVPDRHIDTGHGYQRDTFVPDQIQCAPIVLEAVQRREQFSQLPTRQIMYSRNNVARRVLEIRLEIAASDDALVGIKVDQYQGPVFEQADLGNDRPPQGHQYSAGVDRLERQFFEHGSVDPDRQPFVSCR